MATPEVKISLEELRTWIRERMGTLQALMDELPPDSLRYVGYAGQKEALRRLFIGLAGYEKAETTKLAPGELDPRD